MAVKKKAGRISPVFMGDYDNSTIYRRLDWVYYGGTSYICKKSNTTGIAPSDTEKWQKIIELPTELDMIFEEAATRENIASGDKLSVVLGKIKKWYSDLKKVAFTGKFEDLVEKPGVVSKTENGFVQKGDGQANKVWKTDANGNPGWRDDANTQAVTSVNNKTGAITLSAKDVKAAPAGNRIEKLTDINEITSIGFWTISAIDPNYATSIGIDNNTGDFHALVLSYNGTNAFNFGTVILSSPRISTYHYEIQVWEGAAQAIKTLNNKNILNTTEQISANTNNLNLAGALALKAAIADYTNKLNSINSNLANKLSFHGRIDVLSNINQLGTLGIYRISSIDNDFATSMEVKNTGDFTALTVHSDIWTGGIFQFGTVLLFSPRLEYTFYIIQVWNNVARTALVSGVRATSG